MVGFISVKKSRVAILSTERDILTRHEVTMRADIVRAPEIQLLSNKFQDLQLSHLVISSTGKQKYGRTLC